VISRTAERIRLGAVAASPVFYQTPLYRQLADDPRVDLTVIFASSGGVRPYDAGFGGRVISWDEDLLEGYEHRFLRRADRNDVLKGFFALRDWDVIDQIRRGRYDAVWVHGYSYLTLWLAIATAWLSGTPLLIREEQTLLHQRPWHRELVRKAILKGLFRFATGLYIGFNNHEFFRAYGMPAERLFPAPYCVDNDRLQQIARGLVSDRERIRADLGVGGVDPVILCVGKLSAKKGPLTLVDAFRQVRSSLPCRLLIVGEGPLEQEMRRHIASSDMKGVTFAGFLNRSEIPAAYVAADILCVPSVENETWGIVVNEAMNFSLPLIVSDKVGCARDLVQPGRNGLVVRAGDASALAAAIAELVVDPARRQRYGRESVDIVSAWHYGLTIEGIVSAAGAAVRRGVPARATSA
jgi:glycosyltransferase involved in cell wall biosynthesis